MLQVIYVGLGSFVGGALRYIISLLLSNKAAHFPFATFFVNILGSFLIGLVMGVFINGFFNENYRLFLVTGVLGGFTTYSAFSYETFELIKTGNIKTLFML